MTLLGEKCCIRVVLHFIHTQKCWKTIWKNSMLIWNFGSSPKQSWLLNSEHNAIVFTPRNSKSSNTEILRIATLGAADLNTFCPDKRDQSSVIFMWPCWHSNETLELNNITNICIKYFVDDIYYFIIIRRLRTRHCIMWNFTTGSNMGQIHLSQMEISPSTFARYFEVILRKWQHLIPVNMSS